jgi:hypothetical protein
MAEGRFVHAGKGYAFMLPSAQWAVDADAWVYEREFGRLILKKRESRYVQRDRRGARTGNDLEIRLRRPRTYEELILNMDIGFQHKTRPMQLLIGTISKAKLVKFLKGRFKKADMELPENLIVGYLQRLQLLYSSQNPAAITSRKLPLGGQAYRLEGEDGRNIQVVYGIALAREYLFIALRAIKTVSESDLKAGLQDLDGLVDALVQSQ